MKKWSIVLAALFATSLFVHVVVAKDKKEGDKPRVRKARGEGAEARPKRGGHRPGMGGMMLMRAIDADKDGELSEEELDGAKAAIIRALDKNGDKKIDKDELQPPKRKGEGKRPKQGGGEDGKARRKRPKAKGDK